MSLVDTVRDVLADAGTDSERTREPSKGSYWCRDCAERIPDFEHDGDDPPACPECGDEMSFERTPDSGSCAC